MSKLAMVPFITFWWFCVCMHVYIYCMYVHESIDVCLEDVLFVCTNILASLCRKCSDGSSASAALCGFPLECLGCPWLRSQCELHYIRLLGVVFLEGPWHWRRPWLERLLWDRFLPHSPVSDGMRVVWKSLLCTDRHDTLIVVYGYGSPPIIP